MGALEFFLMWLHNGITKHLSKNTRTYSRNSWPDLLGGEETQVLSILRALRQFFVATLALLYGQNWGQMGCTLAGAGTVNGSWLNTNTRCTFWPALLHWVHTLFTNNSDRKMFKNNNFSILYDHWHNQQVKKSQDSLLHKY